MKIYFLVFNIWYLIFWGLSFLNIKFIINQAIRVKLRFLLSYLKEAFTKGTVINDYNLKSAAVVGGLGHPFFAYFHQEFFEMWDSIPLKIVGGIICLLLFAEKRLPKLLKPYFPFYWHLMLIYNLSFLITLTALNNDFAKTWFLWELTMIFILIMYIPNWLIFIIDLLIGVALAMILHVYYYKGTTLANTICVDNIEIDFLLYLSVFIFAIIAGLLFSHSNAKGIASLERAKIFKSLAGSIAHELRNPLNAINLIGMQIKDMAINLEGSKELLNNSKNLNLSSKITTSNLKSLTYKISESISNANDIINIILNDLNEKKIYSQDIKYVNPDSIIPQIIEKYGYKNEDEMRRVKYNPVNDPSLFIKIVPERFKYIIFNLIKNALYYNKSPDFVVNIGCEKIIEEGVEYNSIYILDNGPGIPQNSIPYLFDDFYTIGKAEGTGLGLSFCKRNMLMFGGDIICKSKLGKWTKFSLLFPQVSLQDLEKAQLENGNKRILLVDDQEINLLTAHARINKNLPNIICELARGGKEAVEMAHKNNYDLILMDIQMPDVDGIEATRRIRKFNRTITIIALTSLDKDSFNKLLLQEQTCSNFNYYLSKSANDRIFYRGITKWFIDYKDNMSYVGEKEEYTKNLYNKKILLADDQQINRLLVSKNLESNGAIVTQVCDGRELLEAYKNSLDSEGKSGFDIIITDIVMPPFNGDECSQEIRAIESTFKISHHDEIPIIALSGNGAVEDINHYFNCRITDYFIKGLNPELLIKTISIYLAKRPARINKIDFTEVIKHETSEIVNLNQSILGEHFDKEKQSEILQMFIKDIDNFMEKINHAIAIDDKSILLSCVHSIKGSAVNIGADRLYYFCKMMESKIKENEINNNWFEEMKKIYLDLKHEIKYFYK